MKRRVKLLLILYRLLWKRKVPLNLHGLVRNYKVGLISCGIFTYLLKTIYYKYLHVLMLNFFHIFKKHFFVFKDFFFLKFWPCISKLHQDHNRLYCFNFILIFMICHVHCHTSYNSFYKWTKISSLEIIIFEHKNDGKKWSRIYFEIH